MPGEQTSPYRKFRRSKDDRMLAGVCGAAAPLLGVDAPILRVVAVAVTLLGFGVTIPIYLACWLVVPEE
jgi:phage shock protein C